MPNAKQVYSKLGIQYEGEPWLLSQHKGYAKDYQANTSTNEYLGRQTAQYQLEQDLNKPGSLYSAYTSWWTDIGDSLRSGAQMGLTYDPISTNLITQVRDMEEQLSEMGVQNDDYLSPEEIEEKMGIKVNTHMFADEALEHKTYNEYLNTVEEDFSKREGFSALAAWTGLLGVSMFTPISVVGGAALRPVITGGLAAYKMYRAQQLYSKAKKAKTAFTNGLIQHGDASAKINSLMSKADRLHVSGLTKSPLSRWEMYGGITASVGAANAFEEAWNQEQRREYGREFSHLYTAVGLFAPAALSLGVAALKGGYKAASAAGSKIKRNLHIPGRIDKEIRAGDIAISKVAPRIEQGISELKAGWKAKQAAAKKAGLKLNPREQAHFDQHLDDMEHQLRLAKMGVLDEPKTTPIYKTLKAKEAPFQVKYKNAKGKTIDRMAETTEDLQQVLKKHGAKLDKETTQVIRSLAHAQKVFGKDILPELVTSGARARLVGYNMTLTEMFPELGSLKRFKDAVNQVRQTKRIELGKQGLSEREIQAATKRLSDDDMHKLFRTDTEHFKRMDAKKEAYKAPNEIDTRAATAEPEAKTLDEAIAAKDTSFNKLDKVEANTHGILKRAQLELEACLKDPKKYSGATGAEGAPASISEGIRMKLTDKLGGS